MMSDDILNLQLDKPPARLKPFQELQRYTIDDAKFEKKPIERALYLLSKGEDIQKLSVVESVPHQLLEYDNNGTITKVIPKIQKELANTTSEFHIVASQMYQVLFKMRVPINVVAPIIQGIDSRDNIVSTAWMDTLLSILPDLPEEVVKTDVLKCAVARSQATRSTFARVSSCRLLGKICSHPKVGAALIQREIIPLVHSLCQDVLYEVRAAICRELPYVATGVAKLGEPINLMPLLVELSNDDNVSVRAAAIDGLVLMVPLLSSATVKNTIIPLVKQLCSRSTSQDDVTFFTIAKIYGKLIDSLMGNLSVDEAVWFMDFYKHLCLSGSSDDLESDIILGTTCREYCAMDLPVMTTLVKKLLPQEMHYWYKIFSDLAKDRNCSVRKQVGQHFETIAGIMGNKNKILKPDFISLLKDDSQEVLQSLVPSIGGIIKNFAQSELITRDNSNKSTLEIGRALMKCQSTVLKTNDFRLKVAFIKQLEKLPLYFSSEFIHQHFTASLMSIASTGKARPIRLQAARTLLVILRYNISEVQRRWIRETIINDLARSRSCYTRIIFVKMCEEVFSVFSTKYFKEHFFSTLIALTDDPVSNVRLCVVNMCPRIKRMLVLPIDRPLLVRLESSLSKMEITEKDKDVLFALKSALKQMGSPQAYKTQDMLIEEKRKIEEEEAINKGKMVEIKSTHLANVTTPMKPRASSHSTHTSRIYHKGKLSPVSSISNVSYINNNETMSFLDKHFYIDAGVALPDTSLVEPTNLETDIDTLIDQSGGLSLSTNFNVANQNQETGDEIVISVENTDMENLSEKDLKKLEITTNITDDVKVNLQKITQTKDVPTGSEGVKKRNKRSSCIFNSERKDYINKNVDFKRRSLNIGFGDTSKIPVSFKSSSIITKNKSESTHNLSTTPSKIPAAKSRILDTSKHKNDLTKTNATAVANTGVKENIPRENESTSNTVKESHNSKISVSNLPVLIRSPK